MRRELFNMHFDRHMSLALPFTNTGETEWGAKGIARDPICNNGTVRWVQVGIEGGLKI